MKKLIYFSLTMLIFSFFTISCSQDDTEVVPKLLTTKTIKFNNGSIYKVNEYTYDETKLTQILSKDGNNNVLGKVTIEYNMEFPIRLNKYDGNENLIEYISIEYESNQPIKYIKFNSIDNTALKFLITYTTNGITKNIYSGDFVNQDNFIKSIDYEINNENVVKVTSNNYIINYTYDDSNGIFKNITSKSILNITGILHNPLDYGVNNNALSYEYIQGNITDHINRNHTYDSQNYPINTQEVSTEFGNSNIIEYEYNH